MLTCSPEILQQHPSAAALTSASLLRRDGDALDLFPLFSWTEELGCHRDRGGGGKKSVFFFFSLALVNAQDMTPIFSFCL